MNFIHWTYFNVNQGKEEDKISYLENAYIFFTSKKGIVNFTPFFLEDFTLIF